jgi:hypothetical protein
MTPGSALRQEARAKPALGQCPPVFVSAGNILDKSFHLLHVRLRFFGWNKNNNDENCMKDTALSVTVCNGLYTFENRNR